MLLIALTGGLASGKTSVADSFAHYHIPIIDADRIAHALTAVNTPALDQISQHFSDILNQDHSLNRKKLRSIIFSHKKEKKWLEELLHPLIQANIKEALHKLHAPYAIVVIPLLVETAFDMNFDRIIVVDTPESLQIERAMARDDISYQQANMILAQQASRQQRLTKADDIITNDSTKETLKKQVKQLHEYYLQMI